VYRYRYIVIAVMVALSLGGGIFGLSLGKHVTQSGFYDDGSQSVKASVMGDKVYGRDRTGHIVAIFKAPDGKTINDPAWAKRITDELNKFKIDHPDQVVGWAGYLAAPDTTSAVVQGMATQDKKATFVSIPLKGDDDDSILNNYKAIAPDLQKLDGGKVQLAGLEPVANALTGTIATDQQRMEILALPLVAIVLFFVFGGVIAAALPAIVGGLCIAGALGILRLIAVFGPVHYFAQPVVSLVGLGIAIDYGLFIVSRFREEIAEGYDTETAVRRTVITAGRTVIFSAVLIVASAIGLLLFPQGFLKSLTYATIASVMLSAILSITLLPACLGVLGKHVDALGVRTLFRVPFLRNWSVSAAFLNWLADRLQRTKTREEMENGFWGKLVNRVMKRPVLFAVPIILIMLALILPVGKLSLGGISEKYLPPDNSVRQAQEQFDKLFPGYRTNPLTLVIQTANHQPVSDQQIADVRSKAMAINGFIEQDNDPSKMWQERAVAPGASKDPSVRVLQNGMINQSDAARKLSELRAITPPKGIKVLVGGTPALEQDSIQGLFSKMPLMVVILLTTTIVLMFLAFGSVVLPIKATLMSVLTLGSTMGILTWIFVDGHFATWLNFTPTPLTAPVIGLIIALIFGLSTDYEVFLVSRMVEARERGMSTQEAIRIGTATTGRIITAAALIVAVVAGAFVFSDLVMMKYLAFGLMAALLLDATIVRMFLVPSVMKMLGDDCWWAPRWMRRLQTKIGLGEINLPDERKRPTVNGRPARPPVEASLVAVAATPQPAHDPTHPDAPEAHRPAPDLPSGASTTRIQTRPPAEAVPPMEAKTTRISTAGKQSASGRERPADSAPPAPARPPSAAPPTPPAAGPTMPPSAGETRAMPVSKPVSKPVPTEHENKGDPADPTAALPVMRSEADDSDAATKKLNALGTSDSQGDNGDAARPHRRGASGGLSAQDLLRREGRL
jgi:RND superfamily putative drug exporter